jgi:hypothetical protein
MMHELDRWEVEYPGALRDAEAKLLEQRSSHRALSLTGVAISGGGIRSATFALGVFQALAKLGHLSRFDYLSTVSGGGYFGAFYASLFARGRVTFGDVRKALSDDSPQLNYLRNNGRFLAPAGQPDLLLGGAVLFRNWVAVFLVIGCLIVGAGLFVERITLESGIWLQAGMKRLGGAGGEGPWLIDPLTTKWLHQGTESLAQAISWQKMLHWGALHHLWLSQWLLVGAGLVVLAAAPLGWSYFLVGSSYNPSTSYFRRRTTIKPLMLAANGIAIGLGLHLLETRPLVSFFLFYLSTVTMAQTIATDYWLPIRGKQAENAALGMGAAVSLTFGFLFSGGALYAALVCGTHRPFWGGFTFFLILLVVRAFLHFVLHVALEKKLEGVDGDHFPRHMVSVWLMRWLVVAGACLAFGLIQTGGRTLYWLLDQEMEWVLGVLGTAMTALAGFARRWVVSTVTKSEKEKSENSPGAKSFVPALLGTTLAVILAVAASALVTRIVYHDTPYREVLLGNAAPDLRAAIERLSVPLWILLGLSLGFGFSRRFLNNSTHLPLYSARITRAYLGATNSERVPLSRAAPDVPVSARVDAKHTSATHLMPNDDIPLRSYFRSSSADSPYKNGAPLHLINVTINETVDGRSGEHNPDAKGVGLAIGPCGMSAGVRHHRVFSWDSATEPKVFPQRGGFRVFEPAGSLGPFEVKHEVLSLGRWLGISGAAFSTGLGLRTAFGTSFLAGITNIRLGHWWFAGVKRPWTLTRILGPLFWVQQYLLRELGARFPGTANTLWYLSDGGHFENMGAYELLRRRVRTLVLLDGEADPHYQFEGLSHLVRKARIDFGTEINFVGREHPEFRAHIPPEFHDQFGTLDEMRRRKRERDASEELSRVHAAIAVIRYPDESTGILVYVKPTLTGIESADVTRYHMEHPSFPHESTGDQFFDEAQWESYRKLGSDIGMRLFKTWPLKEAALS